MPTESQTSYDTDILLRNNGAIRAGQRLTISNRQVTSVSFYLKKVGTPPSTGGYITIYSLADAALATVSVSDAEIQALTASYTLFTKSITPTFINEEVRMIIGINQNTSWTETNCIAVAYQNSDIKASEYFTYFGTIWTNATTQDCAYQYDYGDLTTGVITQSAVTAISGTTATANGNVTSVGVPAATQHGACWNTTGAPTTADSKTEAGVPSTGSFTTGLTGLTAGTKYYVRLYITNTQGTAYSGQMVFWADEGTVYPTNALTRITSITHRYNRGVYSTELGLGGITSNEDIPFVGTGATKAYVTKQADRKITDMGASTVDLGQHIPEVKLAETRLSGTGVISQSPITPSQPVQPSRSDASLLSAWFGASYASSPDMPSALPSYLAKFSTPMAIIPPTIFRLSAEQHISEISRLEKIGRDPGNSSSYIQAMTAERIAIYKQVLLSKYGINY